MVLPTHARGIPPRERFITFCKAHGLRPFESVIERFEEACKIDPTFELEIKSRFITWTFEHDGSEYSEATLVGEVCESEGKFWGFIDRAVESLAEIKLGTPRA